MPSRRFQRTSAGFKNSLSLPSGGRIAECVTWPVNCRRASRDPVNNEETVPAGAATATATRRGGLERSPSKAGATRNRRCSLRCRILVLQRQDRTARQAPLRDRTRSAPNSSSPGCPRSVPLGLWSGNRCASECVSRPPGADAGGGSRLVWRFLRSTASPARTSPWPDCQLESSPASELPARVRTSAAESVMLWEAASTEARAVAKLPEIVSVQIWNGCSSKRSRWLSCSPVTR